MATMAPVRPTIVCPHCLLVQYKTVNSNCRRCHVNVDGAVAKVVAQSEPEKVQRCTFKVDRWAGRWLEDVIPVAIYYFRECQGLSQNAVAKKMGVPRTYMSKVENGKACPTVPSFLRLADALGVSPARILLFCEEMMQACVVSSPVESEKKEDCDGHASNSTGVDAEGLSLLRVEGMQAQGSEDQFAFGEVSGLREHGVYEPGAQDGD
jgi:transcriptional regulator with XRE-family HTH domain